MKRRIFELLLDHVRVSLSGRAAAGPSRHVLRISLIWPRMAIAHKTAERAVIMQDGVYRPEQDSWTDRMLFKETVEGPFGVRVEVSAALTATQWSDAIARFGQAVWSLAGAPFIDQAGNPVTALLWRTPFEALGRATAAAAKSAPRLVASGMLDMQCGDWVALQEKRLNVSMHAPDDINHVTRRRVGGKTQARRTVLIRGGDPNGEAEMIARVYA